MLIWNVESGSSPGIQDLSKGAHFRMKKLILIVACFFLFQAVSFGAESTSKTSGLQSQRNELPRTFLKKSEAKVILSKKGESVSLSAAKSTLEGILQRIADHRSVVLNFHCSDPSLDQERRTIQKISADSLPKMLQQLLPEGCRFSPLDREGKQTENDRDIASINIYSKGCAETGAPVRVFSPESKDRLQTKPPEELSLEKLGDEMKRGGPSSRRRAAEILGIRGDEKAIPYAKQALRDADPEVMFAAANALKRLGKKFGPEKVSEAIYGRFLEKPYPEFLPHLAEVDQKNIWAIFDAFMDQSDEREKGIMTRALFLTRDRRAIPYLSRLASNGGTENSRQAMYAMGKIGGPEAASALIKVIREGDPERQAMAVQAISFLPAADGAEARAEIDKVLKEGKASDQTLQGLVTISYLDPLEKLMKDPSSKPDLKVRSLRAMAERGSEKTLPVMGIGLNDEDPQVRYESVRAMGYLTAEPAIPYFVKASEDKDAKVREAAVRALAEFPGNYQVITTLGKAIHDGDEKVRRSAVEALSMLGKPSKEVIEILADCEKNHKDPYVASKAGRILRAWNVK